MAVFAGTRRRLARSRRPRVWAARQIYRPVDDPNSIAVDLAFDSRDDAEAFKLELESLWRSPQAGPALGGTPKARIVDMVESRQY